MNHTCSNSRVVHENFRGAMATKRRVEEPHWMLFGLFRAARARRQFFRELQQLHMLLVNRCDSTTTAALSQLIPRQPVCFLPFVRAPHSHAYASSTVWVPTTDCSLFVMQYSYYCHAHPCQGVEVRLRRTLLRIIVIASCFFILTFLLCS